MQGAVGPLKQIRNVLASYRHEPAAATVSPESLVSQPKDWTVLAYLEGRDRLSNSVHVALNGMEEIGSTESVNLVAQATMVPEFGDRRFQEMGEVNTRRYYLSQDHDLSQVSSPILEEFPEQKRLNSENLEDFLCWGIEKFPAKNFMVVVKKHGLGFAANGSTVPLSARELRQTLEKVEQRTGVKPQVLCWDSCNMGQWEVAYELKDRAAVMTGSPEAIPAVEFPYPTMLHNLTRFAHKQDAQTLGKTIVHSYAADAPQTTQMAVDLSKLAAAGQGMRAFVEAVLEAKVPRERLYTNLMKSASFEPKESLNLGYNFRDLGGFLRRLANDPAITSDRVKTAAQEALQGLQEAQLDRNVSHERAHLKGLTDDTGFSAFLPWKQPSQAMRESYGELAWARETGWDRLLDYTLGDNRSAEGVDTANKSVSSALTPGKMGLYTYKKYVSPYLLTACPYDTSCSQYARVALEQHGAWQGTKLAFMRLISCQDGVHGGADNVPGAPPQAAAGPLPELTLQPPPAVEKSPTRKRGEMALFRLARTTGKVVGGVAAGVLGGLTGAVLGGFWGAKAGAGKLDSFNRQVRQKYGETKTASLQKLENLVAGPGQLVHDKLGGVAGAVAGGLAGASLGLLGGAVFSYRFFGGFAGLALQNKAKESLGELPVHYQTEQILQRDYAK